jgi:hypothetical protein
MGCPLRGAPSWEALRCGWGGRGGCEGCACVLRGLVVVGLLSLLFLEN